METAGAYLDEGQAAAPVSPDSMFLSGGLLAAGNQPLPQGPGNTPKTPGRARAINNKKNQSLQTDPVVSNTCLCIAPDNFVRAKVRRLVDF